MRTFSSVGQSSRLITGRSWVRVPEGPFQGLLVQLVRTPPCHGGGHEFESRTGREGPALRAPLFLCLFLDLLIEGHV